MTFLRSRPMRSTMAPVAILVLLAGVIFLSGALYLVFRLTIRGFGAIVERRQRETEFVLFTGRVPPSWMPRRTVLASGRPAALRRARRRVRRKLRGLIRYHRHTPLVASEKERQSQIAQMKDVAADWKVAEWGEIILP